MGKKAYRRSVWWDDSGVTVRVGDGCREINWEDINALWFNKMLQRFWMFDKVWCSHIALSTVRFIIQV